MPKGKENIIIKRKKVKSENGSGSSTTSNNRTPKYKIRQYDKQLKVISVLLFFFAILLFLALISYTSKDESNTQLSIGEFFGIFWGDDAVRVKAETTYNWLGLLGAVLANICYNYTIGYVIILLPAYLVVWAKYIFTGHQITNKFIKQNIVFWILALLFSAMMGTLMNISWFFSLSKEWSGSVGLFLYSVVSGFLGTAGAFFVILAGIITTLLLGTNLKVDILINSFINFLERIGIRAKDKAKEYSETLKDKIMPDEESSSLDMESDTNEEPNELEPIDSDDYYDPARIIMSNISSKDKADHNIEEKPKPDLIIKGKYTIPPSERFADAIENNDIENKDIENKDNEQDNIRNSSFEDTENNHPNIIEENAEKIDMNASSNEEDDYLDDFDPMDDDIDDDKKLVVTVTEKEAEPEPEFNSPISTLIHDEEINYIPPTLNLLDDKNETFKINDQELKDNAQILQEKLETFKINIENLSVTPGPVVTQYEFVPAAGIKISKIESLADDLAMALKARGIRIIAPIPGKGTVGIEIPNSNPAIVSFRGMAASRAFHETDYQLPIALGKTISGDVYIADLAKMPHLLMAGSTGSGKSVGINTIISSLIYKKHPSELKFVIIDPKKVELQQYKRLGRHFLATSPDLKNLIINDPTDAVIVLKAAVAEMEERYDILANSGQRNINDYNSRVKSGRIKSVDMDHRPMPFIIIVIDELADLMLTASKEIEEPIIRLAQMARAVGIHLILATQRPSVDVITGIIKANFPARLSYLVASRIDSRTILDVQGAEQLLGNGDLLFLPPGRPKPIRLQNPFISTDEVDAVCNHIGNQRGYSSPYYLPSLTDNSKGLGMIDASDRDPLFEEAAKLIIQHQQGSVSLIQRRLKVGYARAGRIVDELEAAGIVGPFDGSKARIVLMESISELERIL